MISALVTLPFRGFLYINPINFLIILKYSFKYNVLILEIFIS